MTPAAAKPARVPVIFRAGLDSKAEFFSEVTAVFPTIPGTNDPSTATCYAHVGQHGSCSREWYAYKTRAATPGEYAPLLAELTRLYERDIAGEGAAKLHVVTRWLRQYDDERRATLAQGGL